MGRNPIIWLTRLIVVAACLTVATGVAAEWLNPPQLPDDCRDGVDVLGGCVERPLSSDGDPQVRSGSLGVTGNVFILGTTTIDTLIQGGRRGGLVVSQIPNPAITPGVPVDIDGLLRLRCPEENCNGFVLTSDATGVATWQPLTASSTSALGVDLKVAIGNGAPSDGPVRVRSNTALTLSWTTAGVVANGCAAIGSWSGKKAVAGTESVTPAATTVTTFSYGLICAGPRGTTADVVQIVVDPQARVLPTLDMKAKFADEPDEAFRDGPFVIENGHSLTIKWGGNHLTRCWRYGGVAGWEGDYGIGGTEIPVSGQVTLAIRTANGSNPGIDLGISCEAENNLIVTDYIPTFVEQLYGPMVEITGNDVGPVGLEVYTTNSSVTIRWRSMPGTDYCVAPAIHDYLPNYPGWVGIKETQGQQTVSGLSLGAHHFGIDCYWAGRVSSAYVTVYRSNSANGEFPGTDLMVKSSPFSDNPFSDFAIEVEHGDSVRLVWSSQGSRCRTSAGIGSWPAQNNNDYRSANGSVDLLIDSSVPPGEHFFQIECNKEGQSTNASDADEVRVYVHEPLAVDFKINGSDGPLTVNAGSSLTASWNTDNFYDRSTAWEPWMWNFCTSWSSPSGYLPYRYDGSQGSIPPYYGEGFGYLTAEYFDPSDNSRFLRHAPKVNGTYVFNFQCFQLNEVRGLISASDSVVVNVINDQFTAAQFEAGLARRSSSDGFNAAAAWSAVSNALKSFFAIPQAEAAWEEPLESPPLCSNPFVPGCSGPLDEGPKPQTKLGNLNFKERVVLQGLLRVARLVMRRLDVPPVMLNPTVDADIDGAVRLRGGDPAPGKVLVSDATGIGRWQVVAGGSVGGALPYVDLKVEGSDGPITIDGSTVDRVNLSWTGTTSSDCVAAGAWSGSQPSSGSAAVPLMGDAAGTLVYSLTCSFGGTRFADSVTVFLSNRIVSESFNFSLDAGSDRQIWQGDQLTNTVNLSLLSQASQPVSLSVAGLPMGSWAIFSSPTCSPQCSSSLRIVTTQNVPVGTFDIRVIGMGGGVVRMDVFKLTIEPRLVTNDAPSVNAGADQIIVWPAASVNLTGTASDDGLPNPPAVLTHSWSKASGPGTVAFGNASQLSTTATFSAPGTYVLRLSASDGQLTASDTVVVTVQSASTMFDFMMSDSGDVSVPAGSAAPGTIFLRTISGTPQAVALSVSGLPAGVTAQFSPTNCVPNIVCLATATFTVGDSVPAGTYPVVVRGTVGSLARTTAFNLIVTNPVSNFDFALSHGGNKSVIQGQEVTQTITATLLSGSTAPVTYSVSGLPAGVTAQFSPTNCNPTCTTELTLTTAPDTVDKLYTVTVRGASGSVVRQTSFWLSINKLGTFTVDAKINGSNGPLTLPGGQEHGFTLSWDSPEAVGCFYHGPEGTSGYMSGPSGSQHITYTPPSFTGSALWRVVCTAPDGRTSDDGVQINFNQPPPLILSLSIANTGQDYAYLPVGTPVSLRWDITPLPPVNDLTIKCQASGAWSGSKPPRTPGNNYGTEWLQSFTPPAGEYFFTLTCGYDGWPAKSDTVRVIWH